jgi:putative salt-induced outer membrane protein
MNNWITHGLLLAFAVVMTATGRAQTTTTMVAPVATNKWEKSASAGLTLTKGNSDTLMFTADVLAAKKWKQEEVNLGASATYGENTGLKNNETLRGFGQWNHLFTDRFYSYVRLEALHDAVADVEYRITFSPGVGYYFIKNETTRLSGEVGPGLVIEKQGSIEKTYFTARLAERFDHKLNDRARIWQSIEFLPQIDDLNNYIINAEVGVEAALTQKLSLRVVAQDTFDREPARGRKQNDVKLVSAIALKF